MQTAVKAAPPITIILVDDHDLVRAGTKHVLAQDSSIEIVGEATGSREAISLIEELQPDVVVLDIRLREGSGLDVARACGSISPATKILVLSAHDDQQYVRSLVRLGVRGYVVKTASTEDLKRAVRDVAEGRLAYPPRIADTVMGLLQSNGRASDASSTDGSLIARARGLLERMGDGLAYR